MTERIYYTDAYRTEFTSRISQVESAGEGRHRVVLEASCFYPTSGGQMNDLGSLAGHAVVDVFEESESVVHLIEGGQELAAGQEIEGAVDAARRRHHRQQHTGQHVLSRVFENERKLPTVSSRLGETGNTLDLEIESLSAEELDAMEDAANRIVQAGLAVAPRFEDEIDLEATRGKIPDRSGPLRVIEIEGFDRNACGGTHCANTSEIGLIALTKTEKIKGGLRIHFHCGDRALQYRRDRDRLVSRLCHRLTTGETELELAVERLADESKRAARKLKDLAKRLAAATVASCLEDALPVEHAGQRLRLVLHGLDPDLASASGEIIARLVDHDDVLAALVIVGPQRCQVIMARGEKLDLDCGAVLSGALAALGGRGGGKQDRAQGGYEGAVEAGLEAIRRQIVGAG